MASRMSALHDPTVLTTAQSVPPASRNGGSSNADVNGASIDLRGRKRGVLFTLNIGALTGSAAVAARLQTGDNPDDAANANWTNVNYTLHSNAQITNKTNANSVFEMSYVPSARDNAQHIRAVLTPEANVSLAGISHIVY